MTTTRAMALALLVTALVAGSVSTAAARFGPSDTIKLGTVWETNPARSAILLTDGTKLIVPPSLNLPPYVVPGASVKAYYVERDGEKIVTLLYVVPPTYP
jgi:hypothetical protein